MGGYKYDDIKARYEELINNAKEQICSVLNEEFDEIIYIRKGELFIDCSSQSPRDIQIS